VKPKDPQLRLRRTPRLGLREHSLSLLTLRGNLAPRGQGQKRKLDLRLDGPERRRVPLDGLEPEQLERRGRPEAGLHQPRGPARPVGDRVQCLDRQPSPHVARRTELVVEADERHHVARGPLEKDALAAREAPHSLAQGPRVVGGVTEELDARGDGVRAVANDRRDGTAVGTNRLEHRNGPVDEPVRIPADLPHLPVLVALPPVDRNRGHAEAATNSGILEPVERAHARLDDRVVEPVDVLERGRPGSGSRSPNEP
jgi:hypothetical protein